MGIFDGILTGFAVALTPWNLLFCLVGVFLGTLVGVLPGLGPAATVALLVPLTLNIDPSGGIIMLAGIYYGAKYGGSTTSILLNLPGEPSSVVTCFDGYAMARKGRAGPALGMSAAASFVGGTVGIIILMLLAPPLASVAFRFSAPEYLGIMCLGLSMVVLLAGDSMLKALLALFVGLWISTIGFDIFSPVARFTFNRIELYNGLSLIIVAIGVFAIGEVLAAMEEKQMPQAIKLPRGIRNLLPTKQDMLDSRFAFVNGSAVGSIAGVLPGIGSTIASFLSYGIEKAVSKHPEKFGTGVPEGVAAPESANNAETVTSLVPLLTMGLPVSSTTAIMLAALILWGIQPGPMLIENSPDLFWGLIASMYIGNILLLILNVPLIPLFAKILEIPAFVMFPVIFGVSIVGIYSDSVNMFDLYMMVAIGVLGYIMRKYNFPTAPLILGVVLGVMLERALRQSLILGNGDLVGLIMNRPIAIFAFTCALIVLASPLARNLKALRKQAVSLKDEG